MAPGVQQVAQIFEDPEPAKSKKHHHRIPSVGDVLRGRRKENSPTKAPKFVQDDQVTPNPLAERHINSPPQPKRIPLKQEDGRPPMHKKTGSSVSLRGLIMGKQSDVDIIPSKNGLEEKETKRTKSSTNIAGLLKKKSNRDLLEEARNRENVSPTKSKGVSPTPLWEQFATQPLQAADGTTFYPASMNRTLEEEIQLYTPRDEVANQPRDHPNGFGHVDLPFDYKPPQRPTLEHKSSRNSIFKENMDSDASLALKIPKTRDQPTSRPLSAIVPDTRPTLDTRTSDLSQPDTKPKRSSRVLDAISTFNLRSRTAAVPVPEVQQPLSPQELDVAFEKVLDARNIPLNMRDTMRNLKPELKLALMRGDRNSSDSSSASAATSEVRAGARSPSKRELERSQSHDDEPKEEKRSRSRSRPRSRILTMSKREDPSPSKQTKPEQSTRSRSKSRPKSVDLTISRPGSSRSVPSSTSTTSLVLNDSATTPGDFIHYLREVQKPSLVEVGKLHKLRLLLRNESVSWTDHFVTKGGMDELVQLLYRIMKVEWREEHEDNLLHETLLCLKGLCTTDLAQVRFAQIENEFFPALLKMLFDPERKGPSEFTTRGVIISLVFAHLTAVTGSGSSSLIDRSRTILNFLRDPSPEDGKQPLEFVSQMHVSRPYRVWCKEIVNVTKEVFWIFLHHMNVIPIVLPPEDGTPYAQVYFPPPRPPHPAAPYVGGVEWEATQYLATHLDLLNGLIASLPTRTDRNILREDLKQSGFEKIMGGSLRTCKEKFYSGVHDGLKIWVSAAKADGWKVEDVRAGPPREQSSPKKSPVKKNTSEIPQLALDVGVSALPQIDDGWA